MDTSGFWIFDHAGQILSAIAAAHVLAIVIVNLTPTPKDNEVLGKIYPWIEKIAGILTKLAKHDPNEPPQA